MACPIHFCMAHINLSASVSYIYSWNLHGLRLSCIYKFQVWNNDQHHMINIKSSGILCHVDWYIVTNVMPYWLVHNYWCYTMLTGTYLLLLCHGDWYIVTNVMPCWLVHSYWCYSMMTGTHLPMLCHIDWYTFTNVSNDHSVLIFMIKNFKTYNRHGRW
jgi:hypothetical protein